MSRYGESSTSIAATPPNLDLNWQSAFARTELFTPLSHRRFGQRQQVEPGELLDRVASIAFIAALPASTHEQVLGRVRDIVRTHPDLRDRAGFPLPYRTDVYWCRRRG